MNIIHSTCSKPSLYSPFEREAVRIIRSLIYLTYMFALTFSLRIFSRIFAFFSSVFLPTVEVNRHWILHTCQYHQVLQHVSVKTKIYFICDKVIRLIYFSTIYFAVSQECSQLSVDLSSEETSLRELKALVHLETVLRTDILLVRNFIFGVSGKIR